MLEALNVLEMRPGAEGGELAIVAVVVREEDGFFTNAAPLLQPDVLAHVTNPSGEQRGTYSPEEGQIRQGWLGEVGFAM